MRNTKSEKRAVGRKGFIGPTIIPDRELSISGLAEVGGEIGNLVTDAFPLKHC